MNKYDFVFLLDEEEELKNLKELVSSLSGKVIKETSLGKKNLAYPIRKSSSFYFFEWIIEIGPKHLGELKKKLEYNENLVRYLLLKVN